MFDLPKVKPLKLIAIPVGDKDLPVVRRLHEQKLLFKPLDLERYVKQEEGERKESKAKLNLTPLNSFPSRLQRRQAARNGGYFKVNDRGTNGWSSYRPPAEANVQTVIKKKVDMSENVL
jgi:hypothetical protein